MVNFWQTSVSLQIMFDRSVQYKITVTHHKISFHYHDIIVSQWCKFDFKNNIFFLYLILAIPKTLRQAAAETESNSPPILRRNPLQQIGFTGFMTGNAHRIGGKKRRALSCIMITSGVLATEERKFMQARAHFSSHPHLSDYQAALRMLPFPL